MIERIAGFSEGHIYELNGVSEPLYIWHSGELIQITPLEYNLCIDKTPEKRWNEVFEHRFINRYGG